VSDAGAASIVNGWSAATTITKIHSLGSQTLFKLAGVSDSCGHVDFWSLPVEDAPRGKAKLAILLTAYAAGKTVSVRCENDLVTDFEVSN
jgi:hypothetical protein